MIRQVGLKYPPHNNHYDKPVSYADIPKDEDGWADASMYRPINFDLVYLKIKDKKTKNGWFSYDHWDGLNFKDDDEVLYWKRNMEEYIRH